MMGVFPHFASQSSSIYALQMKDALHNLHVPSTLMQFRYLIVAVNNYIMVENLFQA